MAEASTSSVVSLTDREREKARYERQLKSAETKKTEIQNELSAATSDHHRRQLQDKLSRIMNEVDNYNSQIQRREWWIQEDERRIAEIRGGAEERQRKEDSKRLFDDAMKDGFVRLNIINMLLSGVAGSGKTNLKLLLTDQPPPHVRNSTGCIEKPVRVNIRPVSSSKYKTTGRGWVEISQEKLMSLLAQIIAKQPKKSGDLSRGRRIAGALQKMAVSSPLPLTSRERISGIPETGSSDTRSTTTVLDQAISKAVESLVSEVEHQLKVGEQECERVITNQEGELFDSTWVYISDSGGQPQFHDISPLFIRHISVAAIVTRLIDDFSSYPLDEYYKEGQLVGTPHTSHMTLGETLKSLIRCIESHCSQEKKSKLMFVGTFLDQLASLDFIEKKNKAVLDMLSASMKKQVVYNESLKHPIFPINTLSREDDTITVAENIRKAIEGCHPLEIKVPVWWFFLDFNLQVLCLQLGRGVLKKRECLWLALRFDFENEDLEAALDFFNEVCIAHYYRSILPDTVFVNAQIPLDKISELTEYAILLRNADTKGAIDGELKRMADEGIITLEFLKLDHFKKHYVEGIFSPEDMLLIMKELLVIAPIPLVGESNCPLSKAVFFMPSLLKSIPPTELVKHRKSSDAISPMAIRFPSGCIRSGVFCCLVVYLMKESKWKVLLPSGDPVLLAKNCVKFRFPNQPCTITLIDSFSYIEVYVNSPPAVSKKLCPTIRDQLLEAIRAACEVLHYNNDSPIVSIFCPCSKSTEQTHLAEINDGYWTCFLQADVWGDLSSQTKIWLVQPTNSQGVMLCSIEDLKRTTGVSDQQLDAEINESDFHMVGGSFDTSIFNGLLGRLNLTMAEHSDSNRTADREGIQAGVAYALRLWRRPNPSRATFRALLVILLSLRRGDTSAQVCKYIVESYSQ